MICCMWRFFDCNNEFISKAFSIFASYWKGRDIGKQSDALCAQPKHGTTEAFFCNTIDIQRLQNADAASFSAPTLWNLMFQRVFVFRSIAGSIHRIIARIMKPPDKPNRHTHKGHLPMMENALCISRTRSPWTIQLRIISSLRRTPLPDRSEWYPP